MNPAKAALPKTMKYGSRACTAILLTGRVKLKIRMPPNPINMPLLSLFTGFPYMYSVLYPLHLGLG
jgi:hypothetical protein